MKRDYILYLYWPQICIIISYFILHVYHTYLWCSWHTWVLRGEPSLTRLPNGRLDRPIAVAPIHFKMDKACPGAGPGSVVPGPGTDPFYSLDPFVHRVRSVHSFTGSRSVHSFTGSSRFSALFVPLSDPLFHTPVRVIGLSMLLCVFR